MYLHDVFERDVASMIYDLHIRIHVSLYTGSCAHVVRLIRKVEGEMDLIEKRST